MGLSGSHEQHQTTAEFVKSAVPPRLATADTSRLTVIQYRPVSLQDMKLERDLLRAHHEWSATTVSRLLDMFNSPSPNLRAPPFKDQLSARRMCELRAAVEVVVRAFGRTGG